MTKHPTLAQAKAALEAADAAREAAEAQFKIAREAVTAAQQVASKARRALTEAREREAVNATARARHRAKALAKQYGISIEREDYGDRNYNWWVLGPVALYGHGDGCPADGQEGPVRDDPCAGDHTCGGWHEVLGNVETYVEDMLKWGGDIAAKLATA